MTEAKHVRLGDFLTPAEIERAVALYVEAPDGTFAARCDAEIIAPVIERINAKLGRENDSRYLAYAVEFAIMAKRPAASSLAARWPKKTEDKT